MSAPVRYYAANGAIDATISHLAVINKAGVAVMTLAAPSAYDDNVEIMILSATAQAHTLTYSTGFGAGGASLDVGTFGGAIGDGICVVSYGGTWYVKYKTNVTLA